MNQILTHLANRYFPGWQCQVNGQSFGITDGKHYIAEPLQDVVNAASPWWLYEFGYAVTRLSGSRDYAKERKRIDALWAQEPV